jgi:hypothetical protein
LEHRELDCDERVKMKALTGELDKLWALEEIKVRQRSRDRIIREGDRNIAYFHAIANYRWREKRIECLNDPDGPMHDPQDILKMAAEFYRELFKKESRSHFSMAGHFWNQSDMITEEENLDLVLILREGAGPDGLPLLFYQRFLELIKGDLVDMFSDFQKGQLDLFRLNFAMLTLVPKVDDASDMKLFRPISLLNCSFKLFSKVLTLRFERVCQRLISKEQNVFIRGRYIL